MRLWRDTLLWRVSELLALPTQLGQLNSNGYELKVRELTMGQSEDLDLAWDLSPVLITDDQPIVEYPELASWLVRRAQQ